jgi:sugar phosphate isomerase/epimerase
MLSRRDLGRLTVGALSLPAMAAPKIDSVVGGIQFGLQSYVFSRAGLPQEGLVDRVIASMVESGLGEIDLFGPVVGAGASVEQFRDVRKKFEDAGIEIYAISGFPGNTQEELRHTFEIAKVVGARLVTLNVTMPAARSILRLVEKNEFTVGIQGNPNMNPSDPDTIARPEQYEAALSLSKRYALSFDVGDAVGGGYDALPFVEANHDRIALLYLKDRRRDRTSVPWGEGDTPLAQILRLIRDRKYPIRCYVDCDYPTSDRPGDVRHSFEYAKRALAE